MLSYVVSGSVEHAVGASSAVIALTMPTVTGIGVSRYLFVSSVACWVAQGSAPVASAGSGSMFVPAATPILIDAYWGAELAVIQDSASGKCSLTPVVQ